MRKIAFISLLLTALQLSAQPVPAWYEREQRGQLYPAQQYFTGFARGEKAATETREQAIARIKNDARVEALATIEIKVENITTDNTQSSILGEKETIREDFHSATTTRVHFDNISDLQVEVWERAASTEIAAFAYIKRTTLVRSMQKQLITNTTKIKTLLESATQQAESGQKTKARETLDKCLPLFDDIEQAQRILSHIDPLADQESLQLQETQQLRQRYNQLTADLRNGISVFISSDIQLFSKPYPAFQAAVEGALSPRGCHFTADPKQADWIITLRGTAEEYNTVEYQTSKRYYSTVEIYLTIENAALQKRVYENVFREKGSHSLGYERAAQDALQQLLPTLNHILQEQIL